MSLVAVTVKDALDTILTAGAGDNYSLISSRNRQYDVKDIFTSPHVVTWYDSGTFDKSKSSYGGPFSHNGTIKIEIMVAAKAKADLTVLDSSTSTAAQLAAALAAKEDANAIADEKLDTVAALVFDLIMRPENDDLGLDWIPERFITGFDKGDPAPRGSSLFLSGTFTMTFEAPETVTGETGTAGTIMDNVITLTSDVTGEETDTAVQGVEVDNE